ncbi:antibiotic resistance protein VanZ [Nocardiopsis synnemataformans]|uniref:antibiotic resistance protein VanZ n=1 Tax=Nocardiopsis synnemataformans TaxID=61305 RepID=UPI003EC03F1F
MGQTLGGGPVAVEAAVVGVPLLVVCAAALYLGLQYRRYGRPHGWPGLCTAAALATAVGLAAYAVWPLPASVDGLCVDPLGDGRSGSGILPAPGPEAGPLALFLAVGLLARHRFRRGAAVTVLTGTALAAAVVAVRATGLLGLYPCAYAEAPPGLVAWGAAATLLGWLLARWALPPGYARGWPAAVADRAAPGPVRRLTGALLDLGLWWFGAAALAALAHALGATGPGTGTRTVALLCLGTALAAVPALTRRDRATPGAASVRLALRERGYPAPAARWRVLTRTCLLQGPVAVLLALGLPWYALAVAAVHVSSVLVRPDGAGVADLLCGVRVCTRATLDGALPSRLVRYSAPRGESVAAVGG